MIVQLVIAMLLVFAVFEVAPQSSEARTRTKLTITQRHDILKAKINRMQKANELTVKEANNLRDDANDIWEKVSRMKSKNGGKLSYKNIDEIEKDLNGLSTSIHKKALEKRVEDD